MVLCYLLSRLHHADTSVDLPFVLFAPHTQWCCQCITYFLVGVTQTLVLIYLLSCLRRIRSRVVLPSFSFVSRLRLVIFYLLSDLRRPMPIAPSWKSFLTVKTLR